MLCLAQRMKKGRNFGNAYKAIAMVTFMLMFSFSGCIGEDSNKSNGATDVNDQGQIDSLEKKEDKKVEKPKGPYSKSKKKLFAPNGSKAVF